MDGRRQRQTYIDDNDCYIFRLVICEMQSDAMSTRADIFL